MPNDPHSFSRPDEAVVKNLDLDVNVDFITKTISGRAQLEIENKKGVDKIYLDTNGLRIERVTLNSAEDPGVFRLADPVKYLGRPLVINLPEDARVVNVYYSTSPDAGALQWLTPEQTQGKRKPFLYTQSQAILARSWVPCQDTPAVRMTYRARIRVPSDLTAVMSAEQVKSDSAAGLYQFQMDQPIPSYLLALAVGGIDFRSTGPRSGVYAEPEVVEAAAWEFAETEKMIQAVEQLYGAYRWDRYDLIVLPPSFPWGGMENPRLTFVTPSVVVGDRSLVSLIAHELSHSWSGNLVTNATWNDFWLNEGFTNYLDHRVMEFVYGKDYDDMLSVLSLQDLKREVLYLGSNNQDTCLKTDYSGRDPEEATTQIPYEKGQFFLRTIESHVGRARWDEFVKKYFEDFAFQSVNTEQFVEYLQANLIHGDRNLEDKLQIKDWVYSPGIPSNIIKVRSEALEKVDRQIEGWSNGTPASQLETSKWSTHEWIHFIRMIPASAQEKEMRELDSAFQFSNSQNAEILNEWLLQAIGKNYKPAYPAIERLLSSIGRRKSIKLLFTALARTEDGLEFAREVYARTAPLYHWVTRDAAERILKLNSAQQ